MTAVCTDCSSVAGSGMPLPYIGRYRFNGGRYKSAVPGRAVPSPTFAPCYAIGAFNVNNMEIVQGITEACGEERPPSSCRFPGRARP